MRSISSLERRPLSLVMTILFDFPVVLSEAETFYCKFMSCEKPKEPTEKTYQDTVGVNVESDLNLRNTTRCRWDTRKFKLAEQVVVLCSGTFTLVNLDEHTRLVVGVGREGFRFLGWNSGVALDQSSEDTTSGFNTSGKRCDIEKKDF